MLLPLYVESESTNTKNLELMQATRNELKTAAKLKSQAKVPCWIGEKL